MIAVGIRDLKNRLSEYLRTVRRGEVVLVTERGKVIAQVAPPPTYLGLHDESEQAALLRLARSGTVRIADGEIPSATAEPLPLLAEPVDLARALDEMRRDRS